METSQRDKDVGGFKSYSVMIPIIVVLAILHVIVIVTIVQINSASAGLTAIMRKQGEYMKDATSLLAGSSLMSETSANYILKPNMDTGGTNISALAAYATEIQKPRRGKHVVERFRGYDVSEEIKSRIGVAAASANEMMKSQLHAIALVNSVYPMPDVEPLNKIPLPRLTEEELSYPAETRRASARNLVLNPVYGLHKQSVSQNINASTQDMENRAGQLAAETGKKIAMLRMLLWGLTIVIMLLVFGTFALLYKQLVHPLNDFVELIRSNSPLNDSKGMREVRLVAQAYNALLKRRDTLDSILRSAAETDTLTLEVKNMDGQLQAMEASAVVFGAQIDALKAQVSAKDQEIALLKGEAEDLKSQIDQLTAENQSLQDQIYRRDGKPVNQYAVTNQDKVRLRRQADTGSYRIRELRRGESVFVLREVTNSRYETWAYVEVNGQNGYIMMDFLDLANDGDG